MAQIINNFLNGQFVKPETDQYLDVTTPFTGEVIAKVALSGKQDLENAVKFAEAAFEKWSSQTVKTRVQILFRVHQLIDQHKNELAELVMKEHGKNRIEALGSIEKGNETVEYACSLPQLIQGNILEVSRGVTCQDRRDPVGIVASIVPFNFPIMVPLWTIPIALAAGNVVILKPSEKVPITMSRVVQLFKEAGLPDGVLQILNGTAPVVEGLCDHPSVKAVTFVGTTRVAELISKRCRNLNKRVLALGGAKNHLIAYPDCNLDLTSSDVVASFSGCAGQRCMAASALLTIGHSPELLEQIRVKAEKIKPGTESGFMGPVIDQASKDKIVKYINDAVAGGAKLLVDGRTWANNSIGNPLLEKGYWVGPTVILHTNENDPALKEEIFGPVLSVLEVKDKEEALRIQQRSEYGNAAAIYTSSGAVAEWFTKRFSTGMMGVNIGVPVPREPFSFGGTLSSKFGDHDITGDGGLEFFTIRKKITTKWGPPQEASWLS